MSYRKCDENLGRVLDRFDPDTPVFLYFKGGTAYFDHGVSKAGELCDNPYIRGLHCVWKRNSQIAGWRGWELGVDTPFDSRKYRHLEEDEQLRLLRQFLDKDDWKHIRQIAEAGCGAGNRPRSPCFPSPSRNRGCRTSSRSRSARRTARTASSG